MRVTVACLSALSVAMLLASCGGKGTPNDPVSPLGQGPSTPLAALTPARQPLPDEVDPTTWPQIADAGGMASGVMGVFYLERDAADPTNVRLTMPRSAQAPSQGHLFHLSIRPFMSPLDLVILGTSAGPDDTTDYQFRFTHPFDMPTNLDPPQSASKRVDLFIFDTNLVAAAEGSQSFFTGSVTGNFDAMPNADGYRGIGPLVDLTGFGITNANIFPYKLIHNTPAVDPEGNYDAATGWIGAEYLNPTGYDVIPQGAQADVSLRLSNTLPDDPLPLFVVAKYMDPRGGNTAFEKRQNRLPSADPTGLRYFLPEACGDMQTLTATVNGSLLDTSSSEVVTVNARVQDWDAMAVTATTFPDHSNITRIAERSGVQDAQISVPELKAGGVFNVVNVSPVPGDPARYLDLNFQVNNNDLTYQAPPEGATLRGLIRLRDQQDFASPVPVLLDEALEPAAPPSGFQPSSRYLPISIDIARGLRAPQIVSIEPLEGMQGETVQFVVNTTGDPVESWDWALTFSFDPPVSTEESPTMTLLQPGTQRCAVTVTNAAGSDSEFFNFEILPPPPVLDPASVTPATFWQTEDATFSASNTGGVASSWEWDFAGATTPPTSTDATPLVTGTIAGTFVGSVTARNVSGESTIPFTFTIYPALPPAVTEITPAWMYGRRPVTFEALLDLGAGGPAESWDWDFGTGCTPATSTEEQPDVTAGMPGAVGGESATYDGTVRVSNRFGDTTVNFQYEIRWREVDLLVHVFTNGATRPTLWWNMVSWERDDVAEWFDVYVNSVFAPAAIRIPPETIEVRYINNPALFNLDNGSENSQLFNYLYNQGDYTRLNYWCINRNNYSGWAGVMDDWFCDYTNDQRGCIGVSNTTQFAQKIAAHELGHVFNLPHTRTRTNPITDLNRNLMGYGTNDVSLLENVFVENPGSCQIWPGNPHSQYQVVNDWINQYSLLPE